MYRACGHSTLSTSFGLAPDNVLVVLIMEAVSHIISDMGEKPTRCTGLSLKQQFTPRIQISIYLQMAPKVSNVPSQDLDIARSHRDLNHNVRVLIP
jgi:hypothetical protein